LRFCAIAFMFSVMKVTNAEQPKLNGIALGPGLSQEQAKAIFALGEETVVFALLAQAKMIAEKNADKGPGNSSHDPSCPSGQKPPYEKPNNNKGRKKRPGRKKGHKGSCRNRPDQVDRTEEHRASCCPDCGGKLKECSGACDRYIEDVLEDVRVEVTRHIIHRDWCPCCRRMVEPVLPDALPKSTIGNGILVLSVWLHFSLGNTISQILAVLNFHLQFKMTPGGLVQMWHRLADILESWYEEIADDIALSGVLYGDETGWRIDGATSWLWCFTSRLATLFAIERSRAGPVVLKFVKECFDGVLVTDFWGAYNVLVCVKQKCLVHLLRDLERVMKYKYTSGDWAGFSKKLKRLVRDGIRLRKRLEELDAATYEQRCRRIEKRLQLMIDSDWTNKEARRLVKRLKRHRDELFTFLRNHDVPFENNFAERMIRGAVIMRKNSYNNRSDRGARTQAVLMSIFTTLKQRGLNPIKAVKQALRIYTTTGKLPALAEFSASNG